MLLESIVPMFFSEDLTLDDLRGLYSVLDKYSQEAYPYISGDFLDIFRDTHLHDWELYRLDLRYENNVAVLRLHLVHHEDCMVLRFENITSLNLEGCIYSNDNPIPWEHGVPPMAYIMDIWFAYRNGIESIILLDDNRCIKVCSTGIGLGDTD